MHWGDGSSDIYTTTGDKTHTYADGPDDHQVTVNLVDEDGTHADAANDHPVHVNNVAPMLTPPANQTADEGTSKLFDLGSFGDPGTDSPWQVTVNWGDSSSPSQFDEGTTGPIADTAHTYADDGTYTVTITVREEGGSGPGSDIETFQVQVPTFRRR